MKTIIRTVVSILLIASGIAVTIFAVGMAFPLRDWLEICGGFFILLIGGLLCTSGIRIALGANIREVFSDLFISLGR